MNHFLYKLIPPRPMFDEDMSEEADADPAVVGGLASFEVCAMPGAIVAPPETAA